MGKNRKMGRLVGAAVLVAAAMCQVFELTEASRPTGAHPGHAYFEQPCCGKSHLRHHKGSFRVFFAL